ncbi:hypothetical protein [Raoultibacter massiliensis]|uniref:hypothetical protein n=1 Tax=Raoultibacter massiliensis TaxID=1852371 RepID=UPI003A9435E8
MTLLEANSPEAKRSFESAYFDIERKLVGTPMCPYQFTCEAVSEDAEIARASARESTEIAIILADEIMDLRGIERSHGALNAILDAARMEYRRAAGMA